MASLYYALEDGTGDVMLLEDGTGNYLLEPITGDYIRHIKRNENESETAVKTVSLTVIARLN